jgi:DNA-binding transcriptional ArsR family regulator
MRTSQTTVTSRQPTHDSGTDAGKMADKAKHAADFLKALAHENRLMILCILSQGEKSVSELERQLELRQPTVSQQLARLRADGLVSARRDGKTIYYSVASPEARVIVGAVYQVFCEKSAKC